MQVFLGEAAGSRLAALVIGMAGLAGVGAGLQAAPITYTSVFVVAGGANGTSSAQVQNGSVVFAIPAAIGTANGGGGAFGSFANATTLTEKGLGVADLSAGALRGNANSFDWTGPLAPPNGGGGQAAVTAEFRETVTLNNATGGNLLLPFAWTVEGEIPALAGGYYRYVFSSIQLWRNNSITTGNTVMQGSSSSFLGDAYAFGYVDGVTSFSQPTGSGHWSTGPVPAPIGAKLMGTLVVSPGQSNIDITALLQLDCRGGWNCNFGNTAKFSFDALPNGLSFTSASGVFLTEGQGQTGGEVPEPGTWAMLGGGLLSVGLLRARRSGGGRARREKRGVPDTGV